MTFPTAARSSSLLQTLHLRRDGCFHEKLRALVRPNVPPDFEVWLYCTHCGAGVTDAEVSGKGKWMES